MSTTASFPGLESNNSIVQQTVDRIIAETPVTDLHTHLYAPPFGNLLLYGIDELLTYHYLIAEVLRATRMEPGAFFGLTKQQQADLIWNELFINRSPISEACRGVLTVLDKLGLDTGSRSLRDYRAYFNGVRIDDHVGHVLHIANLSSVVMTNDPFDNMERPVWQSDYTGDPRFHAALRIDPILNDWKNAYPKLQAWGYSVDAGVSPKAINEVRRFLADNLKRMNALYMAVSLPPDFTYPEESTRVRLIEEAILPVAQDRGVPFAMMIGVKRSVNPALRLAGDGVGKADVGSVERICSDYPENKFMVTLLSRENQHEICVAARKFPNLLLFGCWWFLNNPSLIEEMTRMRLELLGPTIMPQHSDARVLEQVIYKWEHSKAIIGNVLAEKYRDLLRTGWSVHEDEIKRDCEALFGGIFLDFLRR
ncbi:MAG: hypothetical protein AMXMBFR84_14900 [Candidatus Hydrogenedentota bacterium]